MLPIKLRLRNFLSYGDEEVTLDFSSLKVACLSGENGAGKSALFDAITFALWGKARGFTGGEELIHRGAEYMEVELHFEAAGGDVCRAFRTFDRSKTSGQNYAYLHRVEGDELALVAEKVRSVENAVRDLIRVEYDTFVASAYLRQGDADYFTNTSKLQKRHRKELLIDLLDLGRFESLSAAAKTAADGLKSDIERDESVVGMLKEKAALIPEAASDVIRFEKKMKTAEAAFKKRRSNFDETQKRLDELERLKLRLDRLNEEIAETEKELSETDGKISGLDKQKDGYDEVIAVRDRITEEYRKLSAMKEELEEYDRKLALQNNLKEEQRKLRDYETERRKEIEGERNDLNRDLAVLENDIERLQKIIGKRDEVEKGVSDLREASGELKALKQKEDETREIEKKLAKLNADLTAERKGLLTRLEENKKKRAGFEKKLTKKTQIEAKIAEQEDKLTRAREWLEKTEMAEKTMSRIESDEEQTRDNSDIAQQTLNEIEERRRLLELGDISACPVCDRAFDDDSLDAAKAHIAAEIERAQAGLGASRKELAGLSKRLGKTKKELDKYRKKNAAAAVEKISGILTENRTRLEDLKEIADEAKRTDNDISKIVEDIKELEGKSPLASEIDFLQSALDEMGDVTTLRSGLEKRREGLSHFPGELKRVEGAAAEISERERVGKQLRQKLEKACEKLRTDFFTESERAKMGKIASGLQNLDYTSKAHGDLRSAVEKAVGAKQRYDDLKKAESEVRLIEKELSLVDEQKEKLDETLDKREREQAGLERETTEYDGIEDETNKAKERLAEADTTRNEAAQKLGAARQRLGELEAAEAEVKEKEAGMDANKMDFRVYSYLEKAFGRDGIPSLMLQRGLDELEETADEILAGLTRGRISLRIRTEASKKSGKGMKDVFDVEVSDNGVARRYGLFSGGERFRVDFALRVALSQLLARRTGAPLRFLIVDEGFGTQDPDGLAALVEAINEISSRFELILVISHLPTLRDRFPVRVEVSKDPDGVSSFEVVGA
ncbi:MAG: SMC family ATPase [bacterium]|nr:SMC family ATPase [bacterium]